MRIPGFSWCWTAPTAAARRLRQSGWPTGCDEARVRRRHLPRSRRAPRWATGCASILLDRTNMPVPSRCGRDAAVHGQPGAARRRSDRAGSCGRPSRVSDRYLLANIVYQGRRRLAGRGDRAGGAWWRPAGLLARSDDRSGHRPGTVARPGSAPRDRIEDRPAVLSRAGSCRISGRGRRSGSRRFRAQFPRRGRRDCRFYPAPIVLIDASADPEAVFKQIQTGRTGSPREAERRAWHSVRGHDRVVESLTNRLRAGAVSARAFLRRPAGIGKRTFARKLAQAFLCETRPEATSTPAETCPGCLQVEAATHPDFYRGRQARRQA